MLEILPVVSAETAVRVSIVGDVKKDQGKNSQALRVMFRTRGKLITARLEFKGDRAFAVLYEHGLRVAKEVIGEERMELDIQFLMKMNPALGADFFYKQEVKLPDPSKNSF